jgi:hypothetical protein
MTRPVGGKRKSAHPPSGIDGVGRAGGPTDRSQIDCVVADLCRYLSECREKSERSGEDDLSSWLHVKEPLVMTVIALLRCRFWTGRWFGLGQQNWLGRCRRSGTGSRT